MFKLTCHLSLKYTNENIKSAIATDCFVTYMMNIIDINDDNNGGYKSYVNS